VGFIVVCSVEPYDFSRRLRGFYSRLLCSVEPCGSTRYYHRFCSAVLYRTPVVG
jgi:hypothetical protein